MSNFDEIFIKEMSPIDAYNYGRQKAEKELNEIHLCECNKIREDAITEFADWLPQHFDLRFSNNPEVWIDEFFNRTRENTILLRPSLWKGVNNE